MDIIFTVLGLVLLLFSGDWLVKAAVAISMKLGISTLIVSLTVVAFGTSAPELLIAIQASLAGAPGIAVGNVVGSNIANVLMVLGIPALIRTIDMSACNSQRNYVYMIGASLLFIALCFMGPLQFWHGIILLSALFAVLWNAYKSALREQKAGCTPEIPEEIEDADPNIPNWKLGTLLLAALIGLPLGADLLIRGATGIAKDYGMSDAVIGLTLVAVGTSLPELATTVMAALRRHTDVIIGNVIGSNIFNLLAIMGVTSFFGPITIENNFLTSDLWIMLGSSLLLAPFIFKKIPITKMWGIAFCLAYVAYVWTLIT